MFSIDVPSYQAINEELLRAYEYVANKSMAKAAIEVSTKVHDVPLILTEAGLVNCDMVKWFMTKSRTFFSKRSCYCNECLDVHVLSKHCKRCRTWE